MYYESIFITAKKSELSFRIKLMTSIEKKYLDKASHISKSIILFSKNVILEIIEECHKENKKILGIDGFYIWNIVSDKTIIGIQPDLEYSTDYTGSLIKEAYEKSIEFIKSIHDERLFFQIVIDSPDIGLSHYIDTNAKWIPDRTIKNPYLPDDFFSK